GTSSVLLNLKGKIILESAADINTDFEGTSGEYFAVQLKFADEIPARKQFKNKDKIIKEYESLLKYTEGLKKKLSNQSFLEKAAKDVIEKEKQKLDESLEKLEKMKSLI
ncbi:MAG: hypothetical protein NTV87_14240, partial [Ignavibacteriae bacterium]|nr:hypothetical protein [Ignavibacteriota bacterium]